MDLFSHWSTKLSFFDSFSHLQNETVLFWSGYLSFLSHLRLNHVFGIVSAQQTKRFFPSCSQAKIHRLQLKLSFVPVSNFWITPQLSLRRGSRNTEDVEREHKDSTVARHLPLNGPRLKLQTENEKRSNRAGKTCTCGCPVNNWQEISDLRCDGAYETHTHTHTHTYTQKPDRNFWSPPRQVLIKTAKPFFSSSSCALLGWGQETQ